jgi:phosphatidylserine/phosphatidylglycerophosphate/cardiolipin synthase-like enzyme
MALIGGLSADFVKRFVSLLRMHESLMEISQIRIMHDVNNDAAREQLWDFLNQVRRISPDVAPSALALAIDCALAASESAAAWQHVDVVWTGPGTSEIGVRRSAAVLLELIRSAEHEIVILSFAAFRIGDVLEALEERARKGVAMHFVLESKQDSDGRLHTDASAAFGVLNRYRNVKFYTWPLEKRPPGALLHAKAVIVDGRRALTTSANLTENAISVNIELGISIEGGDAPLRIYEQVKALIASGEFSQ